MHIVIGCNTAHNFLPYLREHEPMAHFVDIIEACGNALLANRIKSVSVLATEGTVATRIYDTHFGKLGIKVGYLDAEAELQEARWLIECVKKNAITEESLARFESLLGRCRGDAIVLGCTELPVLWGKMKGHAPWTQVYDPLECVIQKLKKEMV